MLDNPCRAMPSQLKVLTLPESRYTPLKPATIGGILILQDSKEDEPEDLIEPLPASSVPGSEEDEGEEPSMPEPFEYVDE